MHSYNPTDRGMLRNVGSGGTCTCIYTTPPTAECCGMWALVARAHAFAQPHRPRSAAECGPWRHATCIHTTPPTAECCGMWALEALSHAYTQPHRPRNAAECRLWWHIHMHSYNPTDRGMLRNVGSGSTFTCSTTPPTAECCGMWALAAHSTWNETRVPLSTPGVPHVWFSTYFHTVLISCLLRYDPI